MNANVWIDVFIVSKNNKGVIRYIRKDHRDKWPKFYYKESEVYPLKRVQFEDHYITAPNDPVPYLERGYGENWKTPMVYNRHGKHNF